MRFGLFAAAVASAALYAAAVHAAELSYGDLVVPVASKAPVGAPKQGTGGKGHKGVVEPGVSYATTSVKCNNATYEISTGNSKGDCGAPPGGKPSSERACDDGKGNSASASCGGGCGETHGSGSCKVVGE